MSKQVSEFELYFSPDTDKLYEIRKAYRHSAVITSYSDDERKGINYSVISKPLISNSILEWRLKYDNFNYEKALEFAKEIDHMYTQVENNRVVTSTARDIDTQITKSSKELYHYDLQQAYEKTAEMHSEFDIALTTALTLHKYNWDGRISPNNKAWADNFLKANDVDTNEYNQFIACETHLAIFNGFADTVRKNIANRSITQLRDTEVDESIDDTIHQNVGRK